MLRTFKIDVSFKPDYPHIPAFWLLGEGKANCSFRRFFDAFFVCNKVKGKMPMQQACLLVLVFFAQSANVSVQGDKEFT